MNNGKNSRREFGFKLAALSSVGLTSFQTPSTHADQSIACQHAMEADVFQRLLGEHFMVADGKSTFLYCLEDVQVQCAKRTCRPESLSRKSAFTILFAPVSDQLPEQAVCRVTHTRLGELDLFLVPVNGTGKVEAVFA